jgi:glucose-1-phosphate thymidylyltransferase
MHEHLAKLKARNHGSEQRELFMSEVIQHAIDHALNVEGILFPQHHCLDIGTPEDLVKAVRDKNFVRND